MTTKDAWLEQAKWWDDAKPCGCGCGCGRMVAQPSAAGLCSTIPIMTFRRMIWPTQEQDMLATLPEKSPAFCWPTDSEGAKARADFCREQAAKSGRKPLARGP